VNIILRFLKNLEKYVAVDNIYLFRKNVEPKWEDKSNALGCEY
jgi:hypothetical protein